MAGTLHLEIVTPDRQVLSEDVEYVGAPGYEGEFGVLPNHIPFLCALQIGNLYYKLSGKTYFIFVAGGFCDVSDNKVSVLAEVAEKAEEIDVERARTARERAEKRLQQMQEEVNHARARAAIAKSIARMRCRDQAVQAGTCSTRT